MSNHYQTANRVAFKPDVCLTDPCLDPCMVHLLRVAMRTAPPLCFDTMVITSANDSEHSAHSLHYVGRALDIRFLGERPGAIKPRITVAGGSQEEEQRRGARFWVGRMRQQLGPHYDVVLEGNHIHAEYDPKVAGGS